MGVPPWAPLTAPPWFDALTRGAHGGTPPQVDTNARARTLFGEPLSDAMIAPRNSGSTASSNSARFAASCPAKIGSEFRVPVQGLLGRTLNPEPRTLNP